MKTYQLTKNFWLHEYIPESIYRHYISIGKPHYLANMINPMLPIADQFMRDRFGPFLINTWKEISDKKSPLYYQWSGIRYDTPECKWWSFTSTHSYGMGSDKKPQLVTAEEVRADIIKNYHRDYQPLGITCIEDGVNWVHSDLRTLLFNKDELLRVPR